MDVNNYRIALEHKKSVLPCSTTPQYMEIGNSFTNNVPSSSKFLSQSQETFQLTKNTNVTLSQNENVINDSSSDECGNQLDRREEKSFSEFSNNMESTETDEEKDEIILSTYWRNEKFGAAYYNITTSELYTLNEIIDSKPEHSMLRCLYRQVDPLLTLVDSRAQESFLECLKMLVLGNNSTDEVSQRDNNESDILKSKLHFLPNKEYSFESCKRRIYLLRLPQEPADISESDHATFLHSILNFRCAQSVHALGALLKYLDNNWARIDINNLSEPSFLTINTISLNKILTMDDDSYKALQIFNKLSHPSNFKKGIVHSNKEGLSLFGMFNKCHSKIGTKYLRVMLQHPTSNQDILKRRLDTIAFVNKVGHEEIVKSICSSLRYIKNVNGIMTRIKGLRASPYEWKSFFNTLYNGVLICEYCEKYQGNSSLIDALGTRNNYDLFQVAHHMNRVIDFDISKTQGKFTVKLGIDPELDRKKQLMMGLHGLMSSTAKQELEKLPSFIEECTMVYLPNMGYLLGVKAWASNLTREEKEIPDLKFMFQNHDYIHYKSQGCEELDNLIGDTHPEILAHEMRIMMRLTKFLLEHLHTLSAVITLCAELDCMIAIAKVCKSNDFVRPTILKTEKIIDITKGRHPLQELCINSFIPNSTKSGTNNKLITILTGPNASGKSVYLKQVALIVYLVHIGSYVPAESARIGLLDHIYTRIQTVEDITTRMSAFLIDLRQMTLAIRASTSKSLIIIDEFGKGTSEIDGLALLAASIETFIQRGVHSPQVFVSTHFHDVNNYVSSSPHLHLQSMEHVIQDNELVFLYKIIDGTIKTSLAMLVAASTGIEAQIVNRAQKIFDSFLINTPTLNENLKKVRKFKNIKKNMEIMLRNKMINNKIHI